jgi:hypothetical protein
LRFAFGLLFALVCLAGLVLTARDYVRRHPQDVPWTELDLRHPIGRFTGRKIAALGDEPAQCRLLLRQVGVPFQAAPDVQAGPQCGYNDGTRIGRGRGDPRLLPGGLVTSCPVAAGLDLWMAEVVQPAARAHFGQPVASIRHFGSYSCRRIYGRDDGRFSEHATADAVDIAGFELADGTRISVLRDWEGEGARADFLRDVRDGACRLFSTVLSPEYNQAHADHLHFDQAQRGAMGWTLCR